jgi:diaminohydroxyphosphoribosylaminopyrimidine deaminase/5-amino-6-(5-phosphoribosylamino)uracil reductase
MRMALEESKKAIGYTNPNPLVGAIIEKNGHILSKGYHKYFGGDHAEVNAIKNALKKGHEIKDSNIYITLEPCFHYGKTPPCVDEILKYKFKKVFIGIKDPNPKVNGKSIEKLRKNGVIVDEGILKDEITELNKFFIKSMNYSIPYINIKYAQSLDGFIYNDSIKGRFTCKESLIDVHKMRKKYQSILVGAGTILKDNPKLNLRYLEGISPIRIVIDKDFDIKSTDFNIFNIPGKNIIFTNSKNYICNSKITKIVYIKDFSILNILKEINKMDINSVLVEGGGKIISLFYDYSDEINVYISNKIFGKGISPFENLKEIKEFHIKNSFIIGENIKLELKRCLRE